MVDHETISVYDARIDDYLNLIKKDKPDPALLKFIARISPGGLVLDLGCGPAISSATMRTQGLRVDPIDASAEMVELANKTFDIGARQAEFSEISGEDIYAGLWCNFSLLHASRAQFPILLANLAQALKSGGAIHLGMKIGTGEKRDKLGRFYSYYSEQELTDHLQQLGFDIDYTRLAEGAGLAGDLEPWILLQGILRK